MTITKQIASHLRQVYFGGNWTSVNYQQTLADVSWQQAHTRVNSLNTIAVRVYHAVYYVSVIRRVLEGQALQGHDKYSFDLPPIHTQEEWEAFLKERFEEVTQLSYLIEQVPDSRLPDFFTEEKYGTYYRNLQGLIEHAHYHLGQIVLIKKMLG